ncbi:MAG: hypothetical protein JRH20_18840 [Deltaproteobacteria bacterium]|nr:hypothetical protein [Deltaproteobacteria bacterium]
MRFPILLRFILLLCAPIVVTIACSATKQTQLDSTPSRDGSMAFVDAPTTPRDATVDTLAPPKNLSPVVNGSRLRAQQVVAEGLSAWTGLWEDQDLGIWCTFTALADGSVRCLPQAGLQVSNIEYEDDTCSGPGVLTVPKSVNDRWNACNTPPNERYVYQSFTSCLPADLYRLLPQVRQLFLPGDEIYPATRYILQGEECKPLTLNETYRYYRLNVVDTAPFLQAHVETHAPLAGERLGPVELVGEDGAKQRLAFFDTQREGRCSFVQTDTNEWRCMPTHNAAYTSPLYLSEPTCTEPATSVITGCNQHHVASRTKGDDCISRTRLFELGATLEQLYRENSAGECVASTAPADYHALGPELPPSLFVSASLGTASTSGRLAPYGLDAAIDGPLNEKIWDNHLNVRCGFLIAADGKRRCLPAWEPTNSGVTYSDPQCVELIVPSEGCGINPRYVLLIEARESGCGYHIRVYEPGANLEAGLPIYQWLGGECVKSTMVTEDHYAFGAEAPPEGFVEGEVR